MFSYVKLGFIPDKVRLYLYIVSYLVECLILHGAWFISHQVIPNFKGALKDDLLSNCERDFSFDKISERSLIGGALPYSTSICSSYILYIV